MKKQRSTRLFVRLFGAIAAVVMAAVLLVTAVASSVLRTERQDAYEHEILNQLRTLASLLEGSYYIYDVRLNLPLSTLIRNRIDAIYREYKGIVWLVDWSTGSEKLLKILSGDWDNLETLISTEELAGQLNQLRAGNEIRAANLFPDLGQNMVTLGVPWTYAQEDMVIGAVLMHVDVQDLTTDPSALYQKVLVVALLTLALGLALAAFIARSQARPIRQMQAAVAEFAQGRFERRVDIRGSAELMTLADSINRMADDLDNLETSRREFVANVSHELRSPLMSIQGYLQALADGTAREEEREAFLTVVMDETRRLSRLVNDLLELSRMDSGASPLKIAPFDLNEMARRALISALPRLEDRGIEPEVSLDEALPPAMGDADRLRQVVNNLLDNAIKFAAPGGLVALITEDAGNAIRLRVRNDGEPIPEADLPHIFDRFYKVDKAHTAGKGTGLGLAIAQRILAQHGGQIFAESRDGITEFRFDIPKETSS